MKNAVLLTGLIFLTLGLTGNVWAYEGGTKVVATMTHLEKGEVQGGPIFLVPYQELTPSKPIERLLSRLPEPTLSVRRLREEKPGRSLGTKEVVRFWREGKG